ncbi:hypothetical protein SAMN05880574_1215 [Chryseobacterium sp. RU37D]|nr:hypothetical protein SAMN05880574_1215 [Chryseobacterium sp. RU37D]
MLFNKMNYIISNYKAQKIFKQNGTIMKTQGSS